ncbi:ankyrin repeat-containing domain protein [Podospora didyma]|uniref:protein S-acyltransferase n=1 Tax=Podospora didyma TaxID=330526 RepID=A0AAE0NG11_9PEZI|nr:ankyrin repeat-containing domain protein [Podospora didyma]
MADGGSQDLLSKTVERLEQYRVFCFIDTLDECQDDHGQVRDMESFFEQLSGVNASGHITFFRICFSSRHYFNITIKKRISIVLESQPEHMQDISTYLHSELTLSQTVEDQEIRDEILKKPSEIFFGWTMIAKDNENWDEFLLCMRWIIFSKRPLRPEELYLSILAEVDPQVALRPWDPNQLTTPLMIHFIIIAAKGFVEVDAGFQRAQVIHETVQDFFLEDGIKYISPTNVINVVELELPTEGAASQGSRSNSGGDDEASSIAPVDVADLPTYDNTSPSANISGPWLEDNGTRPLVNETERRGGYAARHVLFHSDEAQASSIGQNGFLRDFPVERLAVLTTHFDLTHENQDAPTCFMSSQMRNFLIWSGSTTTATNSWAPREGNLSRVLEQPVHLISDNYTNSNVPDEDIFSASYCREDFRYQSGRGLAFHTAQFGHTWLMNLLLATGRCDVHSRDDGNGQTVLMCAAAHGRTSAVELLLQRGADIHATDSIGRTALYLALQGPSAKTHNSSGLNFLPNIETVRLLLYQGAELGTAGKLASSLAPRAAIDMDVPFIKLLIEKGLDPETSIQYWSRHTLLSWAARYGHTDVVEMLVRKGCDLEARNSETGRTPLMEAVAQGH